MVEQNGQIDMNSNYSKDSIITIEDKTKEFMNLIKTEMKVNDDINFDNSKALLDDISEDSDHDSDSLSDFDNDSHSFIQQSGYRFTKEICQQIRQ